MCVSHSHSVVQSFVTFVIAPIVFAFMSEISPIGIIFPSQVILAALASRSGNSLIVIVAPTLELIKQIREDYIENAPSGLKKALEFFSSPFFFCSAEDFGCTDGKKLQEFLKTSGHKIVVVCNMSVEKFGNEIKTGKHELQCCLVDEGHHLRSGKKLAKGKKKRDHELQKSSLSSGEEEDGAGASQSIEKDGGDASPSQSADEESSLTPEEERGCTKLYNLLFNDKQFKKLCPSVEVYTATPNAEQRAEELVKISYLLPYADALRRKLVQPFQIILHGCEKEPPKKLTPLQKKYHNLIGAIVHEAVFGRGSEAWEKKLRNVCVFHPTNNPRKTDDSDTDTGTKKPTQKTLTRKTKTPTWKANDKTRKTMPRKTKALKRKADDLEDEEKVAPACAKEFATAEVQEHFKEVLKDAVDKYNAGNPGQAPERLELDFHQIVQNTKKADRKRSLDKLNIKNGIHDEQRTAATSFAIRC